MTSQLLTDAGPRADAETSRGVALLRLAGISIYQPEDGRKFWERRPVDIRKPSDAAALGIETVYQDLALCDDLDVVANLFLGRERTTAGFILDDAAMEVAARGTLERLGVTTLHSLRQRVARSWSSS